jgi:hypothetical protein
LKRDGNRVCDDITHDPISNFGCHTTVWILYAGVRTFGGPQAGPEAYRLIPGYFLWTPPGTN